MENILHNSKFSLLLRLNLVSKICSYVLLSKKALFKLAKSGINLTFVDDLELNADYLVHLSGNEGCGR